MLDRGMSMPDSGIQSAMEMLPLKSGVLHIVVTAPPAIWQICVLLMHLFHLPSTAISKDCASNNYI